MKQIWIALFLIPLLITGCKPEGCTDPRASNFSYEAEKDDGSCEYFGCTDPDAENYDPDARDDDGSCLYKGGIHVITKRNSVGGATFLAVEINGGFIGNLNSVCTVDFPDCETACSHLKFTEQVAGYYSLQFWEVKQLASTVFDTLYTSPTIPVQIKSNVCEVVEI